jgi:hypothetical protein
VKGTCSRRREKEMHANYIRQTLTEERHDCKYEDSTRIDLLDTRSGYNEKVQWRIS